VAAGETAVSRFGKDYASVARQPEGERPIGEYARQGEAERLTKRDEGGEQPPSTPPTPPGIGSVLPNWPTK
jgi:hypothetical protein